MTDNWSASWCIISASAVMLRWASQYPIPRCWFSLCLLIWRIEYVLFQKLSYLAMNKNPLLKYYNPHTHSPLLPKNVNVLTGWQSNLVDSKWEEERNRNPIQRPDLSLRVGTATVGTEIISQDWRCSTSNPAVRGLPQYKITSEIPSHGILHSREEGEGRADSHQNHLDPQKALE